MVARLSSKKGFAHSQIPAVVAHNLAPAVWQVSFLKTSFTNEPEMQMSVKSIRNVVIVLAAAMGLLHASLSPAKPYIKFDGIDGEVVEKDHDKWTELTSFSWSFKVSGNGKRGCMTEMEILKPVEISSAALMARAVTGSRIKQAILKVRKKNKQNDYLKITLHDVIVSSVQTAGGSDDEGDMEIVRLSFSQMNGEVTPENPDGSIGKAQSWSVSQSEKC